MKKFFYVFLSCAMLSMLPACGPDEPTPDPDEETPEYLDKSKQSQMKVFVDGEELTADKTIEVTEAEESLGGMQMGVFGRITGATGVRVSVTRSEADQKDELCALGTCKPGDGKLTQDFDFVQVEGSEKWFTHYTPVKAGVYTVSYKFQNYNRTITLTVKYNYEGAE